MKAAIDNPYPEPIWSAWQKILFRFFFIYLLLCTEPWTWFSDIPIIHTMVMYYYDVFDWAVHASNSRFFHIRKILVPVNGSGDTSFAWAALCFQLSLAVLGCIIWSIADRKRKNYAKSSYWLRTFVRYYIIIMAFNYGIRKLFLFQMPFPNYSQLSTPLGDFLPMRLSWMFLGYSATYQMFSGIMEIMAGLFLLFRKTVTLGLFIATGVFFNVMMLNLSYDIPVKIFSMNLVLLCLFLLANDWKRISSFLLNRPTSKSTLYSFPYKGKKMRIAGGIFKLLFFIYFVIIPFNDTLGFYKERIADYKNLPIDPGIYDVKLFVLNSDTLSTTNSLRWNNMIFEQDKQGSIATNDTLFSQRYGRGYFYYHADTSTHTLILNKSYDGDSILVMHYERLAGNELKLWTKIHAYSLYLDLIKNKKHFQLTEKQFHWLSEGNR